MNGALKAAGFLLLCSSPVLAQEAAISPDVARVAFIKPDDNAIGTGTLIETPHGLLIQAKLTGLPPGPHGFHIHEVGTCDGGDNFKSAGGHYAPNANKHGYMSDNGPHAGDLPNQTVAADGSMLVEVFAPDLRLTEGEAAVLDSDGSAIVIHATADDYRSQPSGASGDRLACGVIEQR